MYDVTLNATVTLCDNICYIQVLLSTEPYYVHCNASQSNSPTDCPSAAGEGGGFNTQIKQKLTSRHLPSERHSPKDTYLQTDTHLQTFTQVQNRQTDSYFLPGWTSFCLGPSQKLKFYIFTFDHMVATCGRGHMDVLQTKPSVPQSNLFTWSDITAYTLLKIFERKKINKI